MSLIALRQIVLGFGGPNLLDNAEFSIEDGERIALVGRNGEGKTTLLRVLSGQIRADEGEIQKRDGLVLATLPQELPDRLAVPVFDVIAEGLGEAGTLVSQHRAALEADDDATAEKVQERLNALEAWDAERQIEQAIANTGLPPDALLSSLSGGQMRRALLARATVSKPDLLILDEPTNHLDLPSIEALENSLLNYTGAVVFTTHDRAFLKRLATRIVELDRGSLTSWPGDYDNYLRRKAERSEVEMRERAHQDRKLAEEEVWIRKGIQARRTRNEGRVRALFKLREEHRERRGVARNAGFSLNSANTSGMRVAVIENASVAFGDHVVVRDFSTIIQRGDKVGIVGPNGAGKTTLIRLALGELEATSGEVTIGTRLQVAYFDQRRATLDDNARLMDWVADGADAVDLADGRRHVISYLNDFLFSPERARGPISALSGGERNRLVLAKLFAKPSNMLVLDEPTNDLDIETLELLEERLAEYPGTVLLASHDRAFLDNVVTNTLVFEGDGRITDYAGGHSDWRAMSSGPSTSAKSKQRPPKSSAGKSLAGKSPAGKSPGASSSGKKPGASPPLPASKPSQSRRLSYKEKRELETLPAEIETLEAELEALRTELADPQLYKTGGATVAVRVDSLQVSENELAKMYERWTELDSASE